MSLAQKTRAYAERKGAVICDDPTEKQRLVEYIAPVAALFPYFVEKLIGGVYPYRMGEQGTAELRESDGITWEYHDTDTGKVGYMIGVSIDAMNEGEEYTAFLFMHELAHITTGGEHPRAFHDQLDELLLIYNRATGGNLTNDMFGQQMRYDSRPYVLPNDTQVQQSRRVAHSVRRPRSNPATRSKAHRPPQGGFPLRSNPAPPVAVLRCETPPPDFTGNK